MNKTIAQPQVPAPLPSYTDLIQRKWRLEAELAAIRREMQSRDARAVDQACNLDIPVNT